MIDLMKKRSDKQCLSSYAFDHAQLFGNSPKRGEHLLECPQCRSQHDEALVLEKEFLEKVFTQTLPSITQRVLVEKHNSTTSFHFRSPVQDRSECICGVNPLEKLNDGVHLQHGTNPCTTSNRILRGKLVRIFTHFVNRRKVRSVFVAAAATAVIFVGISTLLIEQQPLNSESITLPDFSYIGEKGAENELEIYCKRNNKVFRVHNKMTLFRDDQIRFVPVFPKAEPHYVMAVSLDSMGNVSKYFPLDTDSAVLVNNDKLPLPGSIILDDVLGPERVWMLFSETPFDFQTVKQVVQSEWERTGSPEKIEHLPLRQNQSGLIFFKGEEP